MKTELYGWQEECLKRWFDHNSRGIVQAVTGSGKTMLALTAMSRLERQLGGRLRVKIVVPTGALMRQWKQALQEHLTDEPQIQTAVRSGIGLRGAGFKCASDCKYMIYVINSARYELARQILGELRQGENVLLIADECHHYESEQNRLIFEFLPYIKEREDHFFCLGLSATLPSGSSLRYLTSVLGRKIYHYGLKEASVGNTISPCNIYHISLSFRADERAEYEELTEQITLLYGKLRKAYPSLHTLSPKELFEELRRIAGSKNHRLARTASSYMNLTFIRKRLVALASARLICACDLVDRLDKKEKIIIFGERISQADELYTLLQNTCPEKVGRFHSQMGSQANKNTLERFRAGSIRILIACKAIDEGLDVPDASVGIILSGTSSQRQRIQRLGRIIRRKAEGEKASLYYLHIEETSEDSCYLPDTEVYRLFELTYDAEMRRFCHPAYDNRVFALLSEMKNSGAASDKIREAERCLRSGCVRADWMLPQDVIAGKIQAAKYVSERNYWVCMKKLSSV